MEFLTEAYQSLERSQQSDAVQKFDTTPFDFKLLAIGVGLTLGVLCAANAWKGEISDRQFFCLRSPSQELRCYDKNNRRFRMTKWHWEQWGKDGRPKTIIPQDYVKASNLYKPFWAIGAFSSFAIAGWMLRHLQNTERKLAVYQEIEDKRDIARAEMQARYSLLDDYAKVAIAEVEIEAALELAANNSTVELQKAEILAETEIEVVKLDAKDALFEAETAGMTEEQKQEYIDFIRKQKTPYLPGTQTLDSINTPSDKIAGGENLQEDSQAIASTQSPDKYRWMKNAIGYPTLLFGGMGAGKSWTTREIVWQKRQAGWSRIVALDPHGTPVEWKGIELIAGYKDIAEFMQWYMDEMHDRYKKYRESGMTEEQWTQHLRDTNQQIAVIAEEFTTWSDNIVEPMPKGSDPEKWKPDPDFIGKWFRCAMTESRKQLMIPLFVAHDRTMEILGKAKGLSKLRDAALLEIELIAHIDPVTTEAKASGEGRIKLPGHGEWIAVELPKLDHKRIDFRLDKYAVSAQVKHQDSNSESQDSSPVPELSAIASRILEIINSGTQPVSFESIRRSRQWDESRGWKYAKPGTEDINKSINELIIKEFIGGNKESGYSAV